MKKVDNVAMPMKIEAPRHCTHPHQPRLPTLNIARFTFSFFLMFIHVHSIFVIVISVLIQFRFRVYGKPILIAHVVDNHVNVTT